MKGNRWMEIYNDRKSTKSPKTKDNHTFQTRAIFNKLELTFPTTRLEKNQP